MGVIRILVRTTLALLWMTCCALGCMVWQIGRGWPAIIRASFFTRKWGEMLVKIMGIRLTVKGGGDQPVNGCLIVSNHAGYLDIVVHAALARLRFASKKEVKYWPVIGWMLAASRPVWIDRKNRTASGQALQAFKASLEHGLNLLVYPEGGTTDDSGDLREFKSTAFEAVAGTNLPVQPLVTVFDPGEKGMNLAWYGDQTLVPHLGKVLAMKQISCTVYVLKKEYAQDGESRKMLALRIYNLINHVRQLVRDGNMAEVEKFLQ